MPALLYREALDRLFVRTLSWLLYSVIYVLVIVCANIPCLFCSTTSWLHGRPWSGHWPVVNSGSQQSSCMLCRSSVHAMLSYRPAGRYDSQAYSDRTASCAILSILSVKTAKISFRNIRTPSLDLCLDAFRTCVSRYVFGRRWRHIVRRKIIEITLYSSALSSCPITEDNRSLPRGREMKWLSANCRQTLIPILTLTLNPNSQVNYAGLLHGR